ncbi:beta-glucosidase [Ceratobasidium sp. AG-I]|nr:beta-glucosidase [Ceratobasidium sp. AG-I]
MHGHLLAEYINCYGQPGSVRVDPPNGTMAKSTWPTLSVCLIWIQFALAQQPLYAQCGGIGWSGGTTCVSGATCTKLNDYYYQCLASSATTTTSKTTSIPVTVTTTISASSTSVSTTSTTSSSTATTATTTTAGSTPTGAWAAAITKAKTAVAKLTVDQKVALGTGVQWQRGHCVGNTPAVSAINFPGLCLQDSPLGVRYADKVSVFPAGINAAATFNRDLIQKRGAALGAEFKGKGVHVLLGPAMNIARAPAAGRNWEGFGGDPYLSGEAAYASIVGIQSQGVQACAKHYLNNEQEHFRETSSSNVDDRCQHEIYLPPFLKSVQAGVASFMCSYNQVNGTYACENSNILNNLLKSELGFQGYVMSDWWATHSGATAVNAGLDMTMPGDIALNSGTTYFGSNLVSAVQSGQVSQTRIDDLATRILAAWYLLGQDSGYPAVNFDSWNINDGFNQHVNVQGDHATLIRTIGAASTVLLKNKNSALPLKSPSTIGVVGNDAGPNSQGINGCTDRSCDNGVLGQGWGSGTAEYPYLVNPLDAIKTKASSIGATVTSSLSDTDLTAAATAARGKDVALVFISADSGEGYITVEGNAGDRNDLKAWHGGDALVAAVAAVNKNTVVVVHSVGQIIMESWIDHANVTAVLWAGLQGQEAGNAVVDVLWGAVNPSGRLPYTIAKSATDYSASVISNGGGIVQIPYAEGLKVDYRAFDANNITPRFEFGFGLSYTTFTYSDLVVTPGASGGTQPTGPGSSLSSWYQDPWVKVTFTLKNTGTVAGTEIPQLYISPPSSSGEPPNALKGFSSVALQAGASTTVSMTMSRYDLSYWNVGSQKWTLIPGTTSVWVGSSSRSKQLTGSLVI